MSWLRRLERDRDNLRAALDWAFDNGDARDDAAALRFAGELVWFCLMRGHLREGVGWVRRAVGAAGPDTPAALTRLLADSGLTPDSSLFREVLFSTLVPSEKPGVFRIIIDTLYPHGKRIELFAREAVEGWTAWGNEVELADVVEETA